MISFENVTKVFDGAREVRALDGFSVKIERKELVTVIGPSGSGKSTFLHLAGCLDLPTGGTVSIDGKSTTAMTDSELTLLRRKKIGFIFQFFNLIPSLTVAENVALPLLIDGMVYSEIKSKVESIVERVGLKSRITHKPEELSGGEMQRVAIARALVSSPAIILADEPTGNLDSTTGDEIMRIIKTVASENSCTLVIVTHDLNVAKHGNKIIRIRDGRLEKVMTPAELDV